MGVACCNCAWGQFYYTIFASQAMKPSYYDNWPKENANTSLQEYQEICAASKRKFHELRRARGMPYRDEKGRWIDETQKTVTTQEDEVVYDDEIPD